MATTTHWAPNSLARPSISSGAATAAEFTRDLVRPGPQQRPAVLDRADAAADGERDEDLLRRPFHDRAASWRDRPRRR